jgi:hypothetical protein
MKLDFQETTGPSTPPGMRTWQAVKRGHSFVILLEELMGEKFVGWTGYSLSWKKLPRGQTNRIPQPFHDSFEDARRACEELAGDVLK